jgi:hypothetical protein
MQKPVINRLGVTHQETMRAVDHMVAKMKFYPVMHSPYDISMTMCATLPKLAGRVPDDVFHCMVVVCASLLMQHLRNPAPPVLESVDAVAEAVANAAMGHIDITHPAIWSAMSNETRGDIHSAIRAEVNRYVGMAMTATNKEGTGKVELVEKQVMPDPLPPGHA